MASAISALAVVILVAWFQLTQVQGSYCPSGWFSFNNSCYRNETVAKVGYWQARQMCKETGADLATMLDRNETHALERSFEGIPGKLDLWMGLYRSQDAHGAIHFRWTDGSSNGSIYDNWFVNEPGQKEPGYGDRYVRFYRENTTAPARWGADANAGTRRGYICKKESWQKYPQLCSAGKCFWVSRMPLGASTAERVCQREGMGIVVQGGFPDSLYETFFLGEIGPYWQANENGQPTCYTDNKESEGCAGSSARVMCSSREIGGCPYGWFHFKEECYLIGDPGKLVNRTQAVNECNAMEAELLNISSHTENMFINSIIMKNESYWINNTIEDYCGLYMDHCGQYNFIFGNGTWKGLPTGYNDWHNIICRKHLADIDDCASSPCKHGSCVDKFRGFRCDCLAGYTGRHCEYENFCPSSWFSYKNYCYRNETETEEKYWDARKKCKETGADLTTMLDEEETSALAQSFVM